VGQGNIESHNKTKKGKERKIRGTTEKKGVVNIKKKSKREE